MARRSWTIIPNDWIQLERVINQLGYNILDIPSSLSDVISDISTVESDLTAKINSDEKVLSDAIVIVSNSGGGTSDAAVVQSHLTYRANSLETMSKSNEATVKSDLIVKINSDEVVLSDRLISIENTIHSDETYLSDAIVIVSNSGGGGGATQSEMDAVSDRLVSVSNELDVLSDSVLSIETYLSDNTASVKSDLILKIDSDEVVLSNSIVAVSNAVGAGGGATQSEMDAVSDRLVAVSDAVGAGGGASQSEMDAVSDRLVAVSDSIPSIETYLSNDTAAVKSDLILKINSDEVVLSDRTTLISNKLYSDIVAEISNRATGDSNLRVALNSDEVVLSDSIVTVSNAVGAGGGASQSEMDAISDRLVAVSDAVGAGGGASQSEMDAVSDRLVTVSDSIPSIETYLSDNTTTLSNALISPTFVDMQITEHAYFDAEFDNGNSGAADIINWTIGNKQKSTLTANCVYTFTAPSGPCNVILKVIQDGTGGRVITWPATVQSPFPDYSTTAGETTIIAFYFDGTNYWGAGRSFANQFDSIVMTDGGTIGQATGPLLTFNDTDNYLEISGCKVGMFGGLQVNGTFNFAADAQANDTYVIILSPAPTAYTTGMMIVFTANTVNTGACTVDVNGLGPKALKVSFNADPPNGWIKAGSVVIAVYDGTNFQMLQPDATP